MNAKFASEGFREHLPLSLFLPPVDFFSISVTQNVFLHEFHRAQIAYDSG